jgi:hypothetical protein
VQVVAIGLEDDSGGALCAKIQLSDHLHGLDGAFDLGSGARLW